MCKIGAEKLVCGAKSEPVGNLSGLLGRLEIEPNFLHEVIIGDESWVFDYDPETLYTKNLYLQDRQLITPSTNMSWNDFEKGSSVSEGADDWVLQHNNAPTHTAL